MRPAASPVAHGGLDPSSVQSPGIDPSDPATGKTDLSSTPVTPQSVAGGLTALVGPWLRGLGLIGDDDNKAQQVIQRAAIALASYRPIGARSDGRAGFAWREKNAMHDLMKPLEPPPNVDPFQWSLDRARRQLIGTELLLVEPSPEAIIQARILLEEVTRDVVRLQRLASELAVTDRAVYAPPLLEFQQQLGRVARLLQGAKRMQWARIRWVGALVQTYTSAGRARLWNPSSKTWTLDM